MTALPPRDRYLVLDEVRAGPLAHPDCPGRGLSFVLFQHVTESTVGTRVTRRVTGAARCAETGDWIPAMAWTDDMERAFRLAAETAPTRPTGYTFRRRFLIVAAALTVALAAMAVVAWRVVQAPNAYQAAQARVEAVASAPSAGDAVLVGEPTGTGRWHVVREATPETVTLQAYDSPSALGFEPPALDPARFTGPTVSVPADAFLRNGMLGADPPAVVTNAARADG